MKELNGNYHIAFKSSDDTSVSVDAVVSEMIDSDSIFKDLDLASQFFQNGSTGYSPNSNGFDGLKLHTLDWTVQPLKVASVHSSFFENEKLFPKNSVQFDNALLMTNIRHEWRSIESKSACECIDQ